MNILIVDDARDIRLLLRVLLQNAGYTVADVANSQEALEHLAATTDRPCLILLGLMMPVMNGWEFRARSWLIQRWRPFPWRHLLSIGVSCICVATRPG
jgi:CheY-like chemotaxis protein